MTIQDMRRIRAENARLVAALRAERERGERERQAREAARRQQQPQANQGK